MTTTAGRQGRFETQFYHLAYEEEFGRVKGHFGPINALAICRWASRAARGAEETHPIAPLRRGLFGHDARGRAGRGARAGFPSVPEDERAPRDLSESGSRGACGTDGHAGRAGKPSFRAIPRQKKRRQNEWRGEREGDVRICSASSDGPVTRRRSRRRPRACFCPDSGTTSSTTFSDHPPATPCPPGEVGLDAHFVGATFAAPSICIGAGATRSHIRPNPIAFLISIWVGWIRAPARANAVYVQHAAGCRAGGIPVAFFAAGLAFNNSMWGVYRAPTAAYRQYVSLYMRVGEGDNVACYAWGAGKRDDLVPALPTRQNSFFPSLGTLGVPSGMPDTVKSFMQQ